MLNYLLIVSLGVVTGGIIFMVGSCVEALYKKFKEDKYTYEQWHLQNQNKR